MHPDWMLLYSLLNGTMQHSASSSAILTCRMQVRQKGAIQGLTTKARVLKKVNRTRVVQMALLLVKITSGSPNFLENVLFARNQDINLQISCREPACSICLDCLAQPKPNKNPLQFPLGKPKSKKRFTSPLDLASGIWVVLPL